jgi:hypothetical protein
MSITTGLQTKASAGNLTIHQCLHDRPLPDSKALPFLRHVPLLQVLCILIAQLEVGVLDRLLDPLLTAQTDDRANALLDRPCCCNACHTNVVLLRDLFDSADNLLVDLIFASMDEVLEELVGLCAR